MISDVLGNGHRVSFLIACVENKVTLGELCNTLRVEWGEYVAEGF
jgi:hypothetical protein